MSLPQFQTGFRVGRYELLAPIGHGGMASVWAARIRGTRGFEKLVAVKTILPHLANDPHFETMFLDEARIASEIVHPNIAQVFDLGEQDGVLYLVCEWIEGESLSALRRQVRAKKEQIPVPIALHIMAGVCAGLHAAHELRDSSGRSLQVVHRDVSPQNIMISDAGAVKVIDFGVAKALNRALGETVTGGLKGKVHYMAPEQARNRQVDRRADLWSVGAMLYHLLAGRVPFDAESTLAILNKLLSGEPPPPLPEHLPGSVKELVARALSIDPSERFQTASEMQVAIAMSLRDVSLPVTDAVIADYVRTHLHDQAEQRRQLVSEAIVAANQATTSHPDGTLIEYVAQIQDLATRVEGPPSFSEPSPPNEWEEPEPVPLVRRSRPDWNQSDPEMNRGLVELRSLVLQTLPKSMPPPAFPKNSEEKTSSISSRTVGVVVALALGLLGVVATWWMLSPATDSNAEVRSMGAETTATPAASMVEGTVPEPTASTQVPTLVVESIPSAPTQPPRTPVRTWPGSSVPPPPPGWELLPSLTSED